MSRERDKIIAAARAKGYEVADLTWEPIGAAAEKEGPSGGWWGRVVPDPTPFGSSGLDWFGGYSWQEAVQFIEDFMPARLSAADEQQESEA
jgi:hypothetical protein